MAKPVPKPAATTIEGRAYATVVGDVVDSRRYTDQRALLDDLRRQFDWVNQRVPAVQPLRPTIGDEFQAAYSTLGAAIEAVMFLRLRIKELPPQGSIRDRDVRLGLAWGAISVHDSSLEPFGQSGPGWWMAREAIVEASRLEQRNRLPASVRTRFAGSDAKLTAMTNAFLLSFDQIIFRMDRKDVAIALGALLGRTQAEMGADLDIGQSTVSKRHRRNGPATLLLARLELQKLST